jgi:hypothetical protein
MSHFTSKTRKYLFWACIGVLITISLVGLIISPLALSFAASHQKRNWADVGNIGQAYGAVSAVMSAGAMIGVVISLQFQVRENRLQHIQCMRTGQIELMKLLIDDPTLFPISTTARALTSDSRRLRPKEWRQGIFTNLIFKHLEMAYTTKYISEESVRTTVSEYFENPVVLKWWIRAREAYHRDAMSAPKRRFFQIVDYEHRCMNQEQQALVYGDPGLSLLERLAARTSLASHTSGSRYLAAAGITAGVAAVGYGFWRYHQHSRPAHHKKRQARRAPAGEMPESLTSATNLVQAPGDTRITRPASSRIATLPIPRAIHTHPPISQ